LISENGARIECGETRSILAGKVPVTVEEKLIIPELIGSRSFPVWARLIRAVGEPGTARARFATWLFVCYLVAAILILVPLSIIARILLYPVVSRRLRAHADRLARPTGRTFAEDGIRPDEPGTECLRQGNGRVPAERTRRQP
jgi:hypothetical protein